MLDIFKKKNKSDKKETNNLFLKTASLLIHAARIDENYTNNEKEIIKKTLTKLGANHAEISQIMEDAEENEKNSNQILDFTREIKNSSDDYKVKIVESLWSIIYSNNEADMYETNLMRRLTGLLYLDNKIIGDIKEKIKKNLDK
tara:strand:+ start:365 stop:796 length:432 start_codon:yes stop_codon:yes gene_type:complete